MDQIDLAELPGATPKGTAWLRLLIDRSTASPTLRYGHAVIGAQPSTWHGESWHYESVTFVSITMAARDLVAALCAESDGLLRLGDDEIAVPPIQQMLQVAHRPSFELHDRDQAPMPSFGYTINRDGGATNTSMAGRTDYVVGPDSPSFTDLDTAYRGFFLGKYDVPANETVPSELLHIRVLDERAYLGPIHIRATELTVEIGGSDPSGAMLEYFSPERRERYAVNGPGTMTIPLASGLPASNTWLWLTEGTMWRDFRALAGPYTSDAQLLAAGVTREQTSRDEQALIEAVVFGGEGPFVEFKSRMPEGGPKTDRMFRSIAAFANGEGGTVVVGVDRDELTVVGIEVDGDLRDARDRLGQLIRSRILPTPPFEITDHVVDGKTVLFVEVARGTARPYGVITDLSHRDKPEFFVRRGASTYPAQPSDLNEIVQQEAASAAANSGSTLWPR